jgi:hypothetical protein
LKKFIGEAGLKTDAKGSAGFECWKDAGFELLGKNAAEGYGTAAAGAGGGLKGFDENPGKLMPKGEDDAAKTEEDEGAGRRAGGAGLGGVGGGGGGGRCRTITVQPGFRLRLPTVSDCSQAWG